MHRWVGLASDYNVCIASLLHTGPEPCQTCAVLSGAVVPRETYQTSGMPLCSFGSYVSRHVCSGKLRVFDMVQVDGTQSMDDVFAAIDEHLSKLADSRSHAIAA